MQIKPIDNISFGYNNILKSEWLKGNLPTVKRGFYGDVLTKKNVSLEHLQPRSKGGKTITGNVALADKGMNAKRGIEPIEKYVTFEMWKSYLKQFEKIKNKFIDGMAYIKAICKEQGFDIKEILK